MGQTGWCSIYACTGHVRAQADVEPGTDTAGVVRNGAQWWRAEGGGRRAESGGWLKWLTAAP